MGKTKPYHIQKHVIEGLKKLFKFIPISKTGNIPLANNSQYIGFLINYWNENKTTEKIGDPKKSQHKIDEEIIEALSNVEIQQDGIYPTNYSQKIQMLSNFFVKNESKKQ